MLAEFPIDDFDVAEAPRFFAEPRDKDPASELDRVKRFRALFRKHFPHAKLIAFTNGGQRSQRALNQARSEGAYWGAPDLMAIGSNIAFLEAKSGTGVIKPHQVALLNWMHARGHRVCVFRKPESAIAWLFEVGFVG